MELEIFVTLGPVVGYFLCFLDEEKGDTESLEASRLNDTTGPRLAK